MDCVFEIDILVWTEYVFFRGKSGVISSMVFSDYHFIHSLPGFVQIAISHQLIFSYMLAGLIGHAIALLRYRPSLSLLSSLLL